MVVCYTNKCESSPRLTLRTRIRNEERNLRVISIAGQCRDIQSCIFQTVRISENAWSQDNATRRLVAASLAKKSWSAKNTKNVLSDK